VDCPKGSARHTWCGNLAPPRRMVLLAASYGGSHGNGRRHAGPGDAVAVPQQQPLRVPPLRMADSGQVPGRGRHGKPHGNVRRHFEPNKGSVSFCGGYSRCPAGAARGQVPKRQSAPSLPAARQPPWKPSRNIHNEKAPSAQTRAQAAFAQSMPAARITPHSSPSKDEITTPRMVVSHRRSQPHKPLVYDYSHHGKNQDYSHHGRKGKSICGVVACLGDGGESQRWCCRCKQPAVSYFDHTCPGCGATVCLSCLDDLKLLLNSFRCPSCGDETANQEKLKSEIWIINAYRSTSRILDALSRPILDVFEEGCQPPGESCAKRTATQPMYWGHPGRPRPRSSCSVPAPPGVPAHGTRPPLDWNPAVSRIPSSSTTTSTRLRSGEVPRPARVATWDTEREQTSDSLLKTRLPVGWEDEGWYDNGAAAGRSGSSSQHWAPGRQAWGGASVEISFPNGGSDDDLSDGEPLPPPPPPLPDQSPYEARPW